jgi:hypothetical protein
MTVRAVEWKKPYTWGVAIEVTEDKVINLRLRDENNLIIWDEEDNEIYVDLQLWDEITPTDDFPVWITTGRAIVDNWWDATGTLVCFKTTSGDNIKLFYTDSGSVFVDNWTWTFKQIYLKSEVDALLATKQNLLTAWDNITIDSNNVISADKGIVISNTQPSDATEWLLWYNTVTDQLKVYDWTDWNWIWGSTYTAWHWINIDSNDEISNTLPFEPTNTWTAGQVLKLDSNWDYWWDNESWWGSDIEYVTSAEYIALLPWAASDGKHYFIYTESGQGRLPREYQEVEYIETTGAQWINTNLFSWTNIQTEVKIWITDARMNMPIFWCYTNAPYSSWYYHLTPYDNAWYCWWDGWELHWWSLNFSVWQTYEIVYNDENGYLNVDWNNIISVSWTTWYPWSTLWIAQRWTNHDWCAAPRYRYYYFKMYNKTIWQYERDFVPCYRKADWVIWMYDLVNNQFYTNSWTWTFTKWPNVN